MEGKFDGMYMIHLDNKHDEWSEEKEKREKPTKRSGTSVQGMVKTQLEIVEVEKASLYPHRLILHLYPRLT